jgi:cytochrome c55X
MSRAARPATALAVLLMLSAPAAYGEPPPARQAELMHRLVHDCGSCHGLRLKGGLGPPLVPAAIAERTDDELVDVILDGMPGTPMPPWDFEIDREEATWLVRRLKEGLSDGR